MDALRKNSKIVDSLYSEPRKLFPMPTTSSIPGLAKLATKSGVMATGGSFLESRRKIDGAEGLWRIRNGLYDLEEFKSSHPGGIEWLQLTKGTDITELFETHHLSDKAERLLPKFYVREAVAPRSVPLTFHPNGFYRTFKKRAVEALKDVDYHRPSLTTNLITDSLTMITLGLSLVGAFTNSYTLAVLAGIFLTWTVVAAHNYTHMRNNFRMYYFDLGLMSSKDWRITHVMSHHMYPNTLWDIEIFALEPFLKWYPYKDKTYLATLISQWISPIVWMGLFFQQAVRRYYSAFMEYRELHFRDFIPLLLPIAMSFVAPKAFVAIKLWVIIILVSSIFFGLVGFNAAHHHPNIFHDGDIYRENMDWGMLELDAVRDREVIDNSILLVLTNFGSHTLHHLLPTVDHYYLPLCLSAYLETCKEFNVDYTKWTAWELLKGQFRQLGRNESKKNHR